MKLLKMLLSAATCLTLCACTPKSTDTSEIDASSSQKDEDYHTYRVEGKEYSYNSHLMNFLITGVDNYDTEEKGQADVILLLSFDRENNTYFILQLDRNALVEIKKFDVEGNFLGWDESYLALAYRYGNGEKQATLYMKDAVSRLLHNIPITYHLTISMSDLPSIQRVVGEMEVTVKDDLLVNTDETWTKGSTITLTPDNVERYIRNRDTHVDGSNEIRMERHQEYLSAYLSKLKELASNNFNSVLSKVTEVAENAYCNIPLSEISDILDMVMDYQYRDIYTIEGEVVQGLVRDEFVIDDEKLPQRIVDLYYTEK